MPRAARWTILLFALAGLGFAGAASWVHYKLLTDPSYVSPCDVSATLNCTQAYLSAYGSIRGVPVAAAGLLWFALVVLIAALAPSGSHDAPAPTPAYLMGLAAVGLVATVYLGHASFFVLHVACLLCIGTYVCVVGIAAGTALGSTGPARAGVRPLADARAIVASPRGRLAAVGYVGAAVLLLTLFPRAARVSAGAPASTPLPAGFETQFADAWAKQRRYDMGAAPVVNANVIIVKFNDWMCPGCKAEQAFYQPVIDRLNAAHPGAFALVIRDWLWNSDCNPNLLKTFSGHEASCVAGAAVRMAGARHKGDEMGAWIFANQEALAALTMAGRLDQASAMIKKQLTSLVADVDYDAEYPRVLEAIRHDEADGQALGVFSTPTYFVNGVRTTATRANPETAGNNLAPNLFELALSVELARTASASSSQSHQ